MTRGETRIDRGETAAETGSEASAIVLASPAADVTEAAATPLEAVSDPIVATSVTALPEDDNIYSREGAGVIAPRLLLSRAKTFRFVPTYRNGSAVRYRFVMDVDGSP